MKEMINKKLIKPNKNIEKEDITLSVFNFDSDESFDSSKRDTADDKKENDDIKIRNVPRMLINGKLSYAPQTSFVINETIRNNITFFNKYNQVN